jgi:zinc finger-containing ubiquitin peptidase 1
MALSYLLSHKAAGNDRLARTSLDIPSLQRYIERSWQQNSSRYRSAQNDLAGRLRNTSQFIGPAEVQALWDYLRVSHQAMDYMGPECYHELINFVERYFLGHIERANSTASKDERAVLTHAPPIYIQFDGHSMTIVGMEKMLDGTRNLIVLDPGSQPSSSTLEWWRQGGRRTDSASQMMEPYRKSERDFRRSGTMGLTLVM